MTPLSTGSRGTREPFKVIGLTGGIAAGKSTAARIFGELGMPVIDADQIARELRSPGAKAHSAILKRFGTAEREELRKLVFGDPVAKRDLEAILHPLIRAESWARMRALAKPVVIYEAALLVETGRARELDGLIAVTASPEARIARLMARDRIARDDAERILAAQSQDSVKLAAADWVIDNSGGLGELREEVKRVAERIEAELGD